MEIRLRVNFFFISVFALIAGLVCGAYLGISHYLDVKHNTKTIDVVVTQVEFYNKLCPSCDLDYSSKGSSFVAIDSDRNEYKGHLSSRIFGDYKELAIGHILTIEVYKKEVKVIEWKRPQQ